MLQARREVVGREHMAYICRGIGAEDARCRTEYHQERHDRDQAEYLGKDEVASRVDTHDVERVNLLSHPHGANLRGDVRAYLSGKDKTHDGRRELEQHNLAGAEDPAEKEA